MIQIGKQTFRNYQEFKEYKEALEDELNWTNHRQEVLSELDLMYEYDEKLFIDHFGIGFDC